MEIFNIIKRLSANSLSLANHTFRLMRLEIELAKKSLPVLAVLVFILLIFTSALWVFLVSLLVVHLITLGYSIYTLLWAVIAAHIVLIICLALLASKYMGNLKLIATRKHLQSFFSSKGSNLP